MSHIDPAILGFIAVIAGFTIGLLTIVLLRVLPGSSSPQEIVPKTNYSIELTNHDEAVLLIRSGGRIVYFNNQAQKLFNVRGESANLEFIIRRTHPAERFIGLCARPGQANLSIGGRMVTANSYLIPYDADEALLVALRQPKYLFKADDRADKSQNLTTDAVKFFADLTREMTASLELETTLETILSNIAHLIPTDRVAIKILGSEADTLKTYYWDEQSFANHQMGVLAPHNLEPESHTDYVISQRKPLLIEDATSKKNWQPGQNHQTGTFHSFLGIPLIAADHMIGTLELASHTPKAFTQNELDILRMLAGQVATALQNALLYAQEQQRARELSGLANLSKATIRPPD